ncbi:MAG: hypothetical protein ACSHX8_02270 [Opitutaceae bacterium]
MRTLSLLFTLTAICLGLTAHTIRATEINNTQDLVEWENLAFEIEDTKCRVGIASVKLSVTTLKSKDGNLVGEYSIVVPLMSSQNDKGRIVLPLNNSTVGDLGEKGGILKGQAISYKEGTTPNSIRCEVLPLDNKTILLAIKTDKRTLEFKSSYTVSDTTPTDS